MVSSVLLIMSQVERIKKHIGIESETKSVKQNADYLNHLWLCEQTPAQFALASILRNTILKIQAKNQLCFGIGHIHWA